MQQKHLVISRIDIPRTCSSTPTSSNELPYPDLKIIRYFDTEKRVDPEANVMDPEVRNVQYVIYSST